ncbi:MAG: hypothetical protein Faunusvirus54_4 [Faunusvirus sp.]|jgi:hypothetical protein|uniref:Uncharacterized protein n=1 Tax=Faunusvirus sp. TaxID=2487766 RepID=A0A3G4ZY63_9VIRU|nr:MAG: hypothetical protein Faunusvirus54_4 [Faunusvirus sp.]
MLQIVLDELYMVFIWVGLWGIIDNLIDKFVSRDNPNRRIAIFTVIILITILSYPLVIKMI